MNAWEFFDRHWFLALIAFLTWPWAVVFIVAGLVDATSNTGQVMVKLMRYISDRKG